MQDGQNLFDPETSFIRGKTWRVAETADDAIDAGEVEPLVIAGVANAGERRLAEYTPSRDMKLGGGDASQYALMVTRELLPFLRANYRLRSGAADTGIGGSSLGGLVSLWMGLRHAEIFGKLAVLSPSVWWNHRFILAYLNDVAPELVRSAAHLARCRRSGRPPDAGGHANCCDARLQSTGLARGSGPAF